MTADPLFISLLSVNRGVHRVDEPSKRVTARTGRSEK